MRSMLSMALLLAAVSAIPLPARADAPTGVELGARLGYSVPGGEIASSLPMTRATDGRVPLWLDVGYRVAPRVYVGGMVAYSFAHVPDGPGTYGCGRAAMDCSLSTLDVGALARVHILPDSMLDPWIAGGLGWEFMFYKSSTESEALGSMSSSLQLNGPTFLRLETGLDVHVTRHVALGPFFSFQLNQYEGCSVTASGYGVSRTPDCQLPKKGLHEWFTFGIRGAYNFGS